MYTCTWVHMYTYVHTCRGQKITLDIISQALSPCVKRQGFPPASASQIYLSRLSRWSQGALHQLRAGIICPGHHIWLLCAFCSYRTWLIMLARQVLYFRTNLSRCASQICYGDGKLRTPRVRCHFFRKPS